MFQLNILNSNISKSPPATQAPTKPYEIIQVWLSTQAVPFLPSRICLKDSSPVPGPLQVQQIPLTVTEA
ncbi:hypothetical protein K493DRAFT_321740 [Basidiobolus meristosporus CBS 931.73]|uniref:Uncharacterized protein n=1 Tax=Basidiobolus meristosporus CBS 931.73 TaxID=1314790 RepID=A0A1Y1WNT6_9FUNG|nr:hypothetical protein K493DRAFT_321740 [Basidiobolus meristosporus CBS 931.73]|eukprot:ORX75200.1 hypothetical protein K493DRAFT_321740 [Basidiobolus meristosporus CBS 931.73]